MVDLEALKKRQANLRILREKSRYIFEEKEATQEEFDKYAQVLPLELSCKFMTGIRGIVSLCTNEHINCRFKGGDYYSLGMKKPKRECSREKIIRLERSL